MEDDKGFKEKLKTGHICEEKAGCIYIFLVFYTFLFIFVGIELWKEDKKGERKSRGKTGPGWNPGLYIHLTAYRLTAIPS